MKTKKVWVICCERACSSCVVNTVYEDKEEALKWIKKENKKLGFAAYYLEQSQLIEKRW